MIFPRLFKLVFYQMVLAGFFSVLATGKLDMVTGPAYLGLIVVAFAWGGKLAKSYREMGPIKTVLVVLTTVLLFLADFMVFSGNFVLSLIHIAMAISALKLFTATKPRDYLYVFLISFGFLLVSTTFTISLSFLIFASWFLVSGMLILMLFEIRTASLRYQPRAAEASVAIDHFSGHDLTETGTPGRLVLPAWTLWGVSLVVFLGIVTLTVPIFIILPRLAFGLWQLDLSKHQFISGFAEVTHLGDIGSIKLNDIVVMRVLTNIPPEQLPADLKWRGIALEHYDGRGWSTSLHHTELTTAKVNSWIVLSERTYGERLLQQVIYLEPLSTRILFFANRPLAVSGDVGRVFAGDNFIMSESTHLNKIKYSGYSDIQRFSEERLKNLPVKIINQPGQSYLEIKSPSIRLATLVKQITAGEPLPAGKAIVLNRYLRDNYRYSLVLMPCPPETDPVEFFLFDQKKGHCEYFASTLAIMLRYARIPSRVVNGFQRGEVNPFNGTFVVRQSDAHSWVEAYFQDAGWIELDPTPATQVKSRQGILAMMGNLFESVQFLWVSSVINYDVSDQARVFQRIRKNAYSLRYTLRNLFRKCLDTFRLLQAKLSGYLTDRDNKNRLGVFSLLCLLGLAVVLAALFLRRRFRLIRPSRYQPQAGLKIYRQFLKESARIGFRKNLSETPREFAMRLALACPTSLLEEFTERYLPIRFKPGEDTTEQIDTLRVMFVEIRRKFKLFRRGQRTIRSV